MVELKAALAHKTKSSINYDDETLHRIGQISLEQFRHHPSGASFPFARASLHLNRDISPNLHMHELMPA